MIQRVCSIVALSFALTFLAIPLASAQSASISVSPVWHPPVQLTSTASDPRTAQAEIWVTSNVQFWLAQFTCTVNGTAMQVAPTVNWNPSVWGVLNTDYTTYASQYSAGKITIVASKLQPHPSVGTNGVVQTVLLVTLSYPLSQSVIANTTSPFTCTAQFLDNNGHPVVTPTIKAPAPLQIVTGYPLNGKVTYQGRASSAGIILNCSNPSATPSSFQVTTSATGSFSMPNVRGLGKYTCFYETALTEHLSAQTAIDLSTQGFTFPPYVLKGGDVNGDSAIDNTDLGLLTSNFGNSGMGPTQGDITGDGKVDSSDLAILTANYKTYNNSGVTDGRHLLIGMSRNPSVLYNNRIWLGSIATTSVIPYGGSSTAKAYWPVLSPDGSKVAYTQEIAAGAFDPVTGFVTKLPRYALFVGPAGGTTGTQITPQNWNYDAFAPAWSLDGSKIAFSCGTSNGNPATAQWTNTSTNGLNGLCVIDAAGSNLSVVTTAASIIQRPTWVSNSQIIVADGGGNLVQYNLANGTSATLANAPCCNSFPVFRGGQLLFLHSDGAGTILRIIDYAAPAIALNPSAVPAFVIRKTPPPAVGYNTEVSDGTAPPSFAGMCGFDVAQTGLDYVVDPCDGSYRFFTQTQNLAANPPAWQEQFTARVFIDGAVGPAGAAGGDPYGIWIRAVGNSVNFVP